MPNHRRIWDSRRLVANPNPDLPCLRVVDSVYTNEHIFISLGRFYRKEPLHKATKMRNQDNGCESAREVSLTT